MKIDIEIGWVLGTTLCFLGLMAAGAMCAVAQAVKEWSFNKFWDGKCADEEVKK